MPDTRWILSELRNLLGRKISNYPVEWVGVDQVNQEIILIKFKQSEENSDE